MICGVPSDAFSTQIFQSSLKKEMTGCGMGVGELCEI